MSGKLRVVHYLNQFFAGVGGEERSDHPVSSQPGPLGPGALLDRILGEEAEVVGTVFCGDGLFAENEEACAAEALAQIEEFAPDLVLAGSRLQRRALRAGLRRRVPRGPGGGRSRRHRHAAPKTRAFPPRERAFTPSRPLLPPSGWRRLS